METGWLVREGKRTLRSVCPQPLLNWREAQFYGKYGEIELHLVEFLCDPKRDAIDVGANEGSYIHFLKRHSRRVYAFEPIPALVEGLKRKFPRDVIIRNIALSSSTGTAVLRMPVVNGVLVTGCSTISPEASSTYGGHQEISVPMETLDNAYSGNVGFIKVDVEGHEEAVLDGARNTIIRCHPRLLLELDERLSPGAVGRVASFMQKLSYRGFFIYQRELLPIERFDPNVMQRPENLPDLTAGLEQRERFGRYIYNFMFFPSDESQETLRRIRDRISQF